MAQFETWLKTDLKKPITVEPLKGVVFSSDNEANLIGVEILDNGSAATVTGNVTGYIIREDGATVTVIGTLSGNKATIVLPSSAYSVVGNMSVVIKVGETTVGACTGIVYRTTTDAIVDPGHVIPSIAELLAKIADCEAATTAANTAASNADAKATAANTAASNADTKAGLANTAAAAANAAASAAASVIAKSVRVFSTVSSMQSDTTLAVGDSVRTKGYYAENDNGGADYVIVQTSQQGKHCEDLDNGLYALLLFDYDINLNALGAKANDSLFDNASILTEAIMLTNTSSNPSSIRVGRGEYYFQTGIHFQNLVSFSLHGMKMESQSSQRGTIFIYTGNSGFLYFETIRFSKFYDISFSAPSGTAIHADLMTTTIFDNVKFAECKLGFWLKKKSGYVKFNECNFSPSGNAVDSCVRLGYNDTIVGTGDENNVEYVYFTRCNFEGQNVTDSGANAIQIYWGLFIYFNACDICNWGGTAVVMDTTYEQNIQDIYFTDMSFVRNAVNLDIKNGGAIARLSIDGSFRERTGAGTESDKIINIVGTSSHLVYNLELKTRESSGYSSKTSPFNTTYGSNVKIRTMNASLTDTTSNVTNYSFRQENKKELAIKSYSRENAPAGNNGNIAIGLQNKALIGAYANGYAIVTRYVTGTGWVLMFYNADSTGLTPAAKDTQITFTAYYLDETV